MKIKHLIIVPMLCVALLSLGAAKCGKPVTDPSQPPPTATDKITLLQVNAKIIVGEVKAGLGFVKQLRALPQLQALPGFNDEVNLAEGVLNELDGASDPFFEAVRAFASTHDTATLKVALEKLKDPVQRLRPHVDNLIKMIADYINAKGGDVNLSAIQTGIAIARLAFDGALAAIPAFIQ